MFLLHQIKTHIVYLWGLAYMLNWSALANSLEQFLILVHLKHHIEEKPLKSDRYIICCLIIYEELIARMISHVSQKAQLTQRKKIKCATFLNEKEWGRSNLIHSLPSV